MAHHIVARHGLSLTTDACKILADLGAEPVTVEQLLRHLTAVGVLALGARALEVFALGHLFDRYLTRVRPPGVVCIHADEARRVRDLIRRSITRAFSPALQPAAAILPGEVEDLRDEFTRWVDALLLTGASLPSGIARRLEVAFDEISASSSSHG